ncbi:MAG: translation elongation factor Ts [candidate division Zixibacteria bacterium]|nr:translation elongation factor Ts [candidate division Zixibacteria bacterium]
MAEITAKMVKDLREQTGAGMMDCKKALSESGGDFEKAIKHLREQGVASAAKKAGRTTSEGIIYSYIHPGDKLGVLVEINCETDFVARTDDFRNFAKDVAMQVAAADPKVVSREEVSAAMIEAEREVYRNQAKLEGKPDKIIEKIVDGKMEKYFSEACLLEQPFVKDNDLTITDVLTQTVAKIGENIKIRRFVRFRLGD